MLPSSVHVRRAAQAASSRARAAPLEAVPAMQEEAAALIAGLVFAGEWTARDARSVAHWLSQSA